MYNLQELVERGYVEKLETEATHLGAGYKLYVKLHNYSIGRVTVDVGIDEYLTDAITLINKMIEVDEEITKTKKPKEKPTVRKATDEEIKKLLDDSKQVFKD